MTDKLVQRAPRPPGENAERLEKSFRTLITKAGYQTPEQARRAEARAAAENEQRRQKARAEHIKSLREACNVFPRYAAARLDDVGYARERLPDEEFARYLTVRDELRTLLDAFGTLVLSGDNGPGKTHLASALVHEFCNAGRPAYYCRAIDFYRKVKSTFGQPGRTAEELIKKFEGFELLVVDEIEVRNESVWENNELRSLIDARYAGLVSTVICTNKTRAQLNGEDNLPPYLSKAMRDRIRQEGRILECNWRSLRGEVVKP